MKNKKKDHTSEIVLGIIAYILVIMISLQYVNVKDSYSGMRKLSVTDTLNTALANMASPQLCIVALTKYTGDALKAILAVTFAIAFFLIYYVTEQQRKAHIDPTIAKGSSHWNEDYKGFYKKHTIPCPEIDNVKKHSKK